MYNNELKESFISSVEVSSEVQRAVVIFKASEKFETKYNVDLSCMNKEQLSETLKDLGGVSKRYNETLLFLIKRYFKWCKNKGLETSDIEDWDFIVGENSVKKHLVANATHLDNVLNLFLDPEDKGTVDNVLRAALWLLYSGVRFSDLGEIKKDDVDFENMCIHYNEKELYIDRHSIKCFKACKSVTEFTYIHPNYAPTVRERMASDKLLSGTKSIICDTMLKNSFTRAKRNAKASGVDLPTDITINHTWISGKFSRIRDTEVAGGAIDDAFMDMVEEVREDKNFTTKAKDSVSKMTAVKQANSYREQYVLWKELFHNK